MNNSCDKSQIDNLNRQVPKENGDSKYIPKPEYIERLLVAENTADVAVVQRDHLIELTRSKADWQESIYDWCWGILANLVVGEDREDQINKIINKQNLDGTWGTPEIAESAIIDTLQVLVMLCIEHRPIPNSEQVLEGVKNLLVECAKYEGEDLVGFELIFPYQLMYLMGNEWFREQCPHFIMGLLKYIFFETDPEVREEIGKLAGKGAWKIDFFRNTQNLFNKDYTLSFSAEISFYLLILTGLTDEELAQIVEMILPNGSVGLSPAATAAVLIILREKQLVNVDILNKLDGYLFKTLLDNEGSLVNLHNIDNSRRLWNLRLIMLTNALEDLTNNHGEVSQQLRYLLQAILQSIEIKFGGVPWSSDHVMPDLDDTGVRLGLVARLHKLGLADYTDLKANLNALSNFQEADGMFFCYPFEATPSLASIEHSKDGINAILELGDLLKQEDYILAMSYRNTLLTQIHAYLTRYGFYQEGKREEAFLRMIQDKWHFSPYYFIQIVASDEDIYVNFPEFAYDCIAYILRRQAENGGWGETFGQTPEETAYAGLALCTASDIIDALPQNDPRFQDLISLRQGVEDALPKAEAYIREGLSGDTIFMPPLWISKNVYRAEKQIQEAFISFISYMLSRKEKPSFERIPEINIEERTIKPDETFCHMHAYSIVYRFVLDYFNKDKDYVDDGKKLSGLWGIALGITDAFYGDVNIAFIGIDSACELIQDENYLKQYLDDIESLMDYSQAQSFIDNYNNSVKTKDLNQKTVSQNPEDFIEATKYLFAWIIVNGENKLAVQEGGAEKVALWRKSLSSELIVHNQAQFDNSKLGFDNPDVSEQMLSELRKELEDTKEDQSPTLRDIIIIYIEKYQHTGAVAPIMLASIASADPNILTEDLYAAIEIMLNDVWTPMLRLAQEIKIGDLFELSNENINLLILAYAILNNLSISDAKAKIIDLVSKNDPSIVMFFNQFGEIAMSELEVYFSAAEGLIVANENEWGSELTSIIRKINMSLVKVSHKIATPDEVLLVKSLGIEEHVKKLKQMQAKTAAES